MPKVINNLPNVLFNPKELHQLPTRALRSVTSKSGLGVYASSDVLYKGAVFGRDSLEVAEDLLKIKPKLVGKILLTLARLQGARVNLITEEEPGKIVHEYRSTTVDGRKIDDQSMQIFTALGQKWGGSDSEMAYYGSVDATPLFIRTVEKYNNLHDARFLEQTVQLRDGEPATLSAVVKKSVDWILDKLSGSEHGLLEYQKVNPRGISNQVWKDSEEFYVHENGEIANHRKPIASIEVQGLTYDALMSASRLFPDYREKCELAATNLRQKIFELFWHADEGRFALGYDYDANDEVRLIETDTANPAALLDTEIFDNLPADQQKQYVTALIKRITDVNFLTDAGVRSRSLGAASIVDHWDYHGSYVSWPKETYDIAKGMRRQGFPDLARQLENRILNVCMKYHAYPEFVYVDEWGRVLATSPSTHSHGDFMIVEGSNQPERVQAWTVSAVMAIMATRVKQKLKPKLKKKVASGWQSELEAQILKKIPIVDRHFNPFALAARYPTYQYKVSSTNKNE